MNDQPNTSRCALAAGSAGFAEFNINNYVQVRLTDCGRKRLRENYDALAAKFGGRLPFAFRLPTEDKDGWSRWQAWDLINQLGEHTGIRFTPPFETTIRIEGLRPNTETSQPRGQTHEWHQLNRPTGGAAGVG